MTKIAQTLDSIKLDTMEITALGRVCVYFSPFDVLTPDFATHTEPKPTATVP